MDIHHQKGFTLVELLVASLLLLVVLSGIYAFFRGQLYAIKTEEARLATVQGGRVGLDFMTREIRIAGYNPTGAAGCGILIAESQRIQVVSNSNENAICGGLAEPDESVTYGYNSQGKKVTRDGQPLVENVPASGFSLAYYNSAGTMIPMSGNPAAVAPSDLSSIRGIKIQISPELKHPDPWIGGNISSTVTTYVYRRNP